MKHLQTEETRNDLSGFDTWDDARILDTLVTGQERAIAAVRDVTTKISEAATAIAPRIKAGGKVIYAGAGTSARIAVQDGSELPATFGMPEAQLAYLIAGGRDAMFDTLADAEDNADDGTMAAAICGPDDILIAVAASGATPYTVAAARRARASGCFVVAIVSNPDSPLGRLANVEIILNSGPEVIAGSTRMGAGTAQKATLNLLSTLTFIKLGAVYDGMMVNVQTGNSKLKHRATAIVSRITGCNEAQASAALDAARGEVKPAALICRGAKSNAAARHLLAESNENLRLALARLAAP